MAGNRAPYVISFEYGRVCTDVILRARMLISPSAADWMRWLLPVQKRRSYPYRFAPFKRFYLRVREERSADHKRSKSPEMSTRIQITATVDCDKLCG